MISTKGQMISGNMKNKNFKKRSFTADGCKKIFGQRMGFSRLNFSLPTKMALMSGTSLRTKFKKMYGTTLFEYFQLMLTQNARILLLTHKYSVKQLGNQPGYSNLSNVTIAFKKEFHHLPHKLIK